MLTIGSGFWETTVGKVGNTAVGETDASDAF